jgi:acetyl esterase/lipase
MDWAYLVISVNGALYTVNAYRPQVLRKRIGPLYAFSFAASWLTIELAWLNLVGQVVATGFFAWKGALRSRTGKLALLVNLATCVGLVGLIVRSLNVRHEVRAAFKDYEAPVLDKTRLKVRRVRNVEYAKVGRKSLKMDVTMPDEPVEPGMKRPAIVQIHGGAWVIGDKREQGLPLLRHLAGRGWVGFNVNYRLSPKATYPDHLIDVKRALAFIRAHADEWGIDPDFVAVTGGSAGGHLTAMMALTQHDTSLQPGFEDADESIQAAVPFYGFYDFTNRNLHYPEAMAARSFLATQVIKADFATEPEKFAAASPMDHISPDAPPFYVIHGSADTLIPVGQARDFVHELRAVSKAPVLYLELAGAQHAFDLFPSIRVNQVVRSVARFLEKVHDEYEAGHDADEMDEVELLDAADSRTADDVTA